MSYAFIDDEVDKVKAQKVRDVIGEWSKYGNIRFDQVSPGENPQIRIRFDTKDGSWSYVGKEVEDIPKAEATMNLAWVTSSEKLDDQESGVILHEFGHTLGLMHEHQSPLREKKLRLIDDGKSLLMTFAGFYPSHVAQRFTASIWRAKAGVMLTLKLRSSTSITKRMSATIPSLIPSPL